METLEKSLERMNLLEPKSFEFEMDDPTIVIDKAHIPDFLRHRFSLWIHNTCGSTLYFKLVEQIPNWVLGITSDIPADGKLGAIGAGLTKHFEGQIKRSLPAGEAGDVGNFVVEAYPDGTYTALIESHSHPTTVYIEDLENWANVQKSGFDDGTAQGWTLDDMVVTDVKSIETGGYSVRHYKHVPGKVSHYYGTPYIVKNITLPATSKVRLSFYWFWRHGGSDSDWAGEMKNLVVYVDDEKVFDCYKPEVLLSPDTPVPMQNNWYGTAGWFKCGVDLSEFANQTKNIKIQADVTTFSIGLAGDWSHSEWYLDDIVIAGK